MNTLYVCMKINIPAKVKVPRNSKIFDVRKAEH